MDKLCERCGNPWIEDGTDDISRCVYCDSDECPNGGDIENDCADCVCSAEYHYENGKCVLRAA